MEEVDVRQEDEDRATLRDDDYEDRGGGEFGYYAQGQNADEGLTEDGASVDGDEDQKKKDVGESF